MKKLLIILSVLFIGCEEEPLEEPNLTTCIYRGVVSTDASQIGGNPYQFVRCDDDENYQTQYSVVVEDCKCPVTL